MIKNGKELSYKQRQLTQPLCMLRSALFKNITPTITCRGPDWNVGADFI